jgi:hypothetical protein
MSRKIVLGICLLGLVTTSSAQEDYTVRKNIFDSMDSMILLFNQRNWDSYANYMLPALVDTIGGKKAFVEFLSEQMSQFDSMQVSVYKKGKILQVVKTPSGYQCVTESFMQMTANGLTFSGSSYDIGVSADGIKWYFLRIEERSSMLTALIPDLDPALKLPASQFENKPIEEFLKNYTIRYQ